MFRGPLPLFFLLLPALAEVQQQTPPPPDTTPARERHRMREQLPPPPEGPWGPDEFGVTWNSPIWRGLFFSVGTYSAASLDMNVPRGVAASSDGINPPIFERLEYHTEKFATTSVSLTADLDVLRFAAHGFMGTYHARTTLTYEDGINPPSVSQPILKGDVYGMRIDGYWPALRLRDGIFEGSVGPSVSVGWQHQDTDSIPGARLLRVDSMDLLTGSMGVMVSFRALLGRFAVDLTGEYAYTAGPTNGWIKELTLGVGYKF